MRADLLFVFPATSCRHFREWTERNCNWLQFPEEVVPLPSCQQSGSRADLTRSRAELELSTLIKAGSVAHGRVDFQAGANRIAKGLEPLIICFRTVVVIQELVRCRNSQHHWRMPVGVSVHASEPSRSNSCCTECGVTICKTHRGTVRLGSESAVCLLRGPQERWRQETRRSFQDSPTDHR